MKIIFLGSKTGFFVLINHPKKCCFNTGYLFWLIKGFKSKRLLKTRFDLKLPELVITSVCVSFEIISLISAKRNFVFFKFLICL